MAKKGSKRKRDSVETPSPITEKNLHLIIDTDYHIGNQGSMPFHQIYNELRDGQVPIDKKEREVWDRVKRSGLPQIVARPAILPYTDMVSFVLDRIGSDGCVLMKDKFVLISYSASNFQKMYRLPVPEANADEKFMDAFMTEHESLEEWLKEWWADEDRFKVKAIRLYLVQHFHSAYRDTAVMLCRLFGEKNCNLFKREWTPIMHVVVEEGKVMNWANILAANLLSAIRKYKDSVKGHEPPFFMAAYVLDLICTTVPFPELNLFWKPDTLAVHEMF